MTGATPVRAGERRPSPVLAGDRAPVAVDPGDRGTTTIADRVVERIAAQAAVEVDDVIGLRRRLAGRDFGNATVRATAQIDGTVGLLSLELGVVYPAPVRATTRAVRARVVHQVAALCDVRLDHVDISVELLRRPDDRARRVV